MSISFFTICANKKPSKISVSEISSELAGGILRSDKDFCGYLCFGSSTEVTFDCIGASDRGRKKFPTR